MEAPITLAKLISVELQESIAAATAGQLAINPDFSTQIPVPAQTEFGRRAGFAGLAFLVWLLSVMLIAFVPALFLLPYLASQGINVTDSATILEFAKSDQTAILLQLGAIIPAHLLTLLLAYLVMTSGRRFSFLKTLGWETGGVQWWHYSLILFVFFAIAVVVGLYVPEQDNELLRLLRSSRAAVLVVAFIATFSAPLVEEAIYRGVLYSAFDRAFGMPAAFLLVTLLFALVHVPQYYPSWSTIALLTLLSMTLTGLRIWSNNLWPCVVLHTIFNGLQSALLISEPWLRQASETAK